MLYAETDRLYVRSLEKSDLPRLVGLIDVWDVVRWLVVVPYPYTMKMAEEFYNEVRVLQAQDSPQFFVLAQKSDNLFMGGIGLHPPRGTKANRGEVEIGYWLGVSYWGQGFVSEGAREVRDIAFQRPETEALVATTSPNNIASQKVLAKIGLRKQGVAPLDYAALRGGDEMLYWQLTRPDWEEIRSNA